MAGVSVVIPTYNSAAFLAAAVKSVLAQTVRDLEIIIVDDGSQDDTSSVVSRFGAAVRYVRQNNRGVAVARNVGIEASRGRYVAFLDADDTWFPHKLERQVAALALRPDVRLCYSAFLFVDAQLRPLGVGRSPRRAMALEDLVTRGNVVGSVCTVLAERALFAAAGGFDPALSQCADWDMWIRLAARTEFLYLDEPLVTYRQHAANMSWNPRLLEDDSMRVLQKAFAMPELPERLRGRRRTAVGRNYMVLAGTYFQARRFPDFVRCATRALVLDPRQASYLATFPVRAARRFAAPMRELGG